MPVCNVYVAGRNGRMRMGVLFLQLFSPPFSFHILLFPLSFYFPTHPSLSLFLPTFLHFGVSRFTAIKVPPPLIFFPQNFLAVNKSKSKGSLLGGLTGATLMAMAYFLMQAQETKAIGYALGFGSTFLFSSVFGIRLAATRKLVPAGPLLAVSLCVMALFVSLYLQDSL